MMMPLALRRLSAPLAAALVVLGLAGAAAAAPVIQKLPFRFTAPATMAVGVSYSFTFRLFDSADLGVTTPVWQETQKHKIPANRVVAHSLGAIRPFSNVGTALPPVDFSDQHWVQVASGARLIGGRVPLGPIVPYALYSATMPPGSVTTDMIQAGAVTDAAIAPGAAIADTKLAQITSAGKVADSALSPNVVLTDNAQTLTGLKTFNPAAWTVPFKVDATKSGTVANLSAEKIGGQTLADLDSRYGAVPPSPSGSTGGYTISTVDAAGDVGASSSITIGVDGLPIMSYYDVSNGDLKVVHCGDAACSAGNTITTADSTGNVGDYTSIAIGADGLPIISYIDSANARLKIYFCGNVTCSNGNVRVPVSGIVGRNTSIAIDPQGHPRILFYSIYYNPSYQNLLFAMYCNDRTCSSYFNVDADRGGNVGTYASLAFGQGTSYVYSCYDETNGDLKINRNSVDTEGNVGISTSITIGADGLPVVSYYDETNGDLKVLHCGHMSCTTGNVATAVDWAGNVGTYTSITIGTDGFPVVSYYDQTNGDLKVLDCGNAACSSGNAISTVDAAGDVGKYTAITIGADGFPIMSYYDATNGDLKVAKGFSKPRGRR